jgi:hypothetical protein
LQEKQNLNPTSQVAQSSNLKQHDLPQDKIKEVERTPETLSKDAIIIGISILGKSDQESLTLFEDFMKHGHNFPLLLSKSETHMKDVRNQWGSTALISPIPSLTPLATSYDLPCSKVINIDDLTPIEPKDMPSSDLFFNKKRKVIIQRESQQKEGGITKKKRKIYDEQGQSDPKVMKEVANSLGAFTTTKLWSMDNLRKQLDRNNILIEQLHNDMKQMEVTAKEKINFDIIQVR